MALVAVLRVPVGIFVPPFEQASVGFNLVGVQTRQGGIDFGHQLLVSVEFECGGTGVNQAFAYQGHVGCRAMGGGPVCAVGGDEAVFGRGGGGGDEFAVALKHPFKGETGGSTQCGIILFQGFLVAAEQVVLPDVGCHPAAAHGPVGPFRRIVAHADGVGHRPYVGVVSQTPSAVHTPVISCGVGAVFRHISSELKQRHVEFGQIGCLCTPVVLFEIDVCGVVAAPRRQQFFVPEALQVGGDAGRL